MEAKLVELDSRRRTALGRIGRPEHVRYLVEETEDGTLLWHPAVVVSEHELAFMRQHPQAYGAIRENQAHLDPARRRPRPLRRSPRRAAN